MNTHAYGPIAQLVERLLCTQEVSGSTPLGSTNIYPNSKSVVFEFVPCFKQTLQQNMTILLAAARY